MASTVAPTLVDAGWIAEHLDDDSVRLIEVDVASTAYRSGHVPGAVLWNVYTDLRGPDYVPADDGELASLLTRSGVSAGTTVVFYGYGAHLGYWLMKSHGHPDARLLDGPREQWLEVGGWSTEEPVTAPTVYRLPPADPRFHASRENVIELIGRCDTVLLDVRSHEEYAGERFWPSGAAAAAGRPGRLPGSVHLPIDELRTPEGVFRPVAEMRAALRQRGLDGGQRIVTYCTVGNRASQAWYALTQLLGLGDVGVYYGSWAEWGHLRDAPIER
jgi:thiosulfate/3-mercaptopyruvate sulfurtransferase